MVLVPRTSGDGSAASGPEGQTAPTWVFPFNRPLPPGEGDNQALAVNTADGSTVYDVAFALVWADGDSVVNTNEAYALASCTDCQTVAVAFQVVLVVGEASVVVPQNLSGAVNYNCVECVTYALAQQLVITLPESLDADSTARLEALWKEIAAFAASIEDVPLSELQARLSAFEAQILEVVRADPGAAPGRGVGRPAECHRSGREPEPDEHPHSDRWAHRPPALGNGDGAAAGGAHLHGDLHGNRHGACDIGADGDGHRDGRPDRHSHGRRPDHRPLTSTARAPGRGADCARMPPCPPSC